MIQKQRVKRGIGRGEMMAAALRLIASRGVHAVTMRDIASESGLSLGSTTYHFDDRTALLRTAFTEFVADTESLIADAVDTDGGVDAAMRTLFADRRQVLIRGELRLEATRDDVLHEVHLRCRDAVGSLVTVALRSGHQPADGHAVWAALAALDIAAIDTAAEHRDNAAFAAAMNTYLADALDVAVAS